MGNSGIESAFQFLSYKIDTIHLEVTKDTRSLTYSGVLRPDQVQLAFSFRNPLHLADNSYVGGVDIQFSIFHSASQTPENLLAQGRAGISGLFKVLGERLPADLEKNLVRVQIPALLMPYLRAAVSSHLASAGFPGVAFPLINVQAVAAQMGEKLQVIEAPMPATPAEAESPKA